MVYTKTTQACGEKKKEEREEGGRKRKGWLGWNL